jgi:hypothetical protein
MKKFFIAFLILAVTAANVFAEITFDINLHGRWDVIAGESGKAQSGKDVYSGWLTTKVGDSPNLIRSRLNVTAVNEEKTWGGWFRIQPSNPVADEAKLWWQPITQVKVTLGKQGIRPFGTFGGLDVHDYLTSPKYAVGDVFPEYKTAHDAGGGKHGFVLELAPIANLKFGVVVPIGLTTVTKSETKTVTGGGEKVKGSFIPTGESDPVEVDITLPTTSVEVTQNVAYDQPAEVSFRRTGVWAGYTLEGIGTIGLGFLGSAANYTNGADYKEYGLADAKSQINVGFDLTAIENLKAQIGFWYPIAQKTPAAKLRQEPITVALAADYTVPSTFGVRFLFHTKFLGKTEQENEKQNKEDGLVIAFTLDPWVNIGVGNVGLGFGLKSTGASKDGGEGQKDDRIELTATPYFSKSYGGGTFYAGVRIGVSNYTNDEQYKDDYGTLSWGIPVGFQYNF